MGYPTKVQRISRKKTADQYYINFPTAIAEAAGLTKGEVVHWEIHDRSTMVLSRPDAPASPLKKNGTLSEHVLAIIAEQAELGAEGEHQEELAQHMLAHLLCTQRRTVTGLLNTLGRQQQDWSKAYRLYRDHVDGVAIFSPVLDGVLELLPEGTALVIGRTRADINLLSIPKQSTRRSAGRPRSYGKQLPTPEALRKDKTVPWEELTICNGPKTTRVRYKRISPAKWHVAGEKAIVQVVVIAPLRYKKRKQSVAGGSIICACPSSPYGLRRDAVGNSLPCAAVASERRRIHAASG